MKPLRILQCNTDNLRHGWKYLENLLQTSDIAILQRYPKDMNPELCDSMESGRAVMANTMPPVGKLAVAIARRKGVTPFIGAEEIKLPSFQHVIAEGNDWLGCVALRVKHNDINIISFLPCYPTVGEFPVTDDERLKDIEFILNLYKDEPTIIAGDFHVDEKCKKTNELLKKYDFTSYLDKHKTFTQPSGELINLDKLVSNINMKVSNIETHVKKFDGDIKQGHHAITYEIEIN